MYTRRTTQAHGASDHTLTLTPTLAPVVGITDTWVSPAAGTQTPPHTQTHTRVYREQRAPHSRDEKELNKETEETLPIRCRAWTGLVTSHCSHTADPFCPFNLLFSHTCSSPNCPDPSLSPHLAPPETSHTVLCNPKMFFPCIP